MRIHLKHLSCAANIPVFVLFCFPSLQNLVREQTVGLRCWLDTGANGLPFSLTPCMLLSDMPSASHFHQSHHEGREKLCSEESKTAKEEQLILSTWEEEVHLFSERV